MNSVSFKDNRLFETSVRLLNNIRIKEGLKNITSSVTFIFGLIEFHHIYQMSRNPKILTKTFSNCPEWIQVVNKMILVCSRISLILSAGISRPGVFIMTLLLGRLFSIAKLNQVFGPNTLFALNPWHPRHVVSIAAVLLALPSHVQSLFTKADNQNINHKLTDKITRMTLFNTLTCRPTLHIINHLFQMSVNKSVY